MLYFASELQNVNKVGAILNWCEDPGIETTCQKNGIAQQERNRTNIYLNILAFFLLLFFVGRTVFDFPFSNLSHKPALITVMLYISFGFHF